MRTKRELATFLGLKSEAQIKIYLDELGFHKRRNEEYPEDIILKCIALRDRKRHNKGGYRGPLTEEHKAKIKAWASTHTEEISIKTKQGMTAEVRSKLSKSVKEYQRNNNTNPYIHLKAYYEQHGRKAYKRDYHKSRSTYMYNGNAYDSSWELIFQLCYPNANRNVPNIEYMYNNEIHRYTPDFELNGTLYELKGPQFWKDGKMVNPFDHSQDDLYEAKHQCMIKHDVVIITDITPFKERVEREYCKEYYNLFDMTLEFPYTGDVWKCHKRGKLSPYKAWYDPILRQKAITNRLKYGPFAEGKHDKILPEDIITAFTVANIAPKVSVFSENRAYYLSRKYLTQYKTIVDPFAGFGGRKEGTEKASFTYIGFDREIKDGIDITKRDILDEYPREQYDALFTCPPYSDKEDWINPMKVIKSCDDWILECIRRFDCKAYLFVVDGTERYAKYIVEKLENKSHFGTHNEYVIFIRSAELV